MLHRGTSRLWILFVGTDHYARRYGDKPDHAGSELKRNAIATQDAARLIDSGGSTISKDRPQMRRDRTAK